jgi:signal transduction histidine kinase
MQSFVVDLFARQAADLMENRRVTEALQEAVRAKDDFLAMLSHELRNPLTPTLLAAHSLPHETVRTAGNSGSFGGRWTICPG